MIESEVDGSFYKGFTTDYLKRVVQHNKGESKFTRSKMPWKLIFVQQFMNKSEALIQEKKLKKCNKKYLLWLTEQKVNILNKSLDR